MHALVKKLPGSRRHPVKNPAQRRDPGGKIISRQDPARIPPRSWQRENLVRDLGGIPGKIFVSPPSIPFIAGIPAGKSFLGRIPPGSRQDLGRGKILSGISAGFPAGFSFPRRVSRSSPGSRRENHFSAGSRQDPAKILAEEKSCPGSRRDSRQDFRFPAEYPVHRRDPGGKIISRQDPARIPPRSWQRENLVRDLGGIPGRIFVSPPSIPFIAGIPAGKSFLGRIPPGSRQDLGRGKILSGISAGFPAGFSFPRRVSRLSPVSRREIHFLARSRQDLSEPKNLIRDLGGVPGSIVFSRLGIFFSCRVRR